MPCSLFTLLGLLTGPVLALALTCNSDYEARSSSLCLTDSPSLISGGVSDADKQTIIDVHNSFRAGVSPTSSNMQKAVWDDNLASMAQKWVNQCEFEHDSDGARYIMEYYYSPGQNLAYGQSTWTDAITAWYNEVSDWSYGTGGTPGAVIGHFTQMVQGGVARIGCGFAACDNNYPKLYLCNYIDGNYNRIKPYKQGEPCADCSENCSAEKLCDCGGKHCFNGGRLDLNTCTCTCSGAMFSGDQCLDKMCPPDEPTTCGPTSSCHLCPFSCGLCKKSEATPCADHPKCHESTINTQCRYMGDQYTPEECATYGESGEDSGWCVSKGGSWASCETCVQYSNVPKQFCPKMCAICPE